MINMEYKDVNIEAIRREWGLAKINREYYTKDFQSLDNLVDGIPLNHPSGTPFVGDTTLAGLVRYIPRQSLQQVPVFGAVVNGSKENLHSYLCSYFLRRAIFNEDTFGKGLLSTLQLGAEQALTHGYAPFMTATGQMFSEFGTSMRLLHWDDVDPQAGVNDAYEADYTYVVANLVPSRVQRILDSAKNNKKTSWNVKALEELIAMDPTSKDYSQHESAVKNAPTNLEGAGTYEFVTRYENGKGGKFVTFCPQVPDKPLRVIENKSKFGYPRVQFLVIDPAALSPFGTSRVRLASPNQNMMNIYYQNISAMLMLNSAPPILQRGRFTTPIQLKQKAKWITFDQNAKAELVTLDNGALSQFTPMSQQMSGQIQNIMGTPKGNLNGGSGSFGYSKTGPGVRQQDKDSDLSSNQITNILENFLRQYALSGLDTYLAEQSGEDVIIVDDLCKEGMNRIAEATFVPTPERPEYTPAVGDDNKFTIKWESFYEAIEDLKIEIELSMNKDELEEKKRADLQDMFTVIAQTADPNDPTAQAKVNELRDMLLQKTVPEAKNMSSSPTQPVIPQPVGNAVENPQV